MLSTLIALLLIGAAAYRVGRFISADTLIEEPRDKAFWWLSNQTWPGAGKLGELLTCPFCMTIWTGLFGTLYYSLVLTDWPGWWFPVYWMTVATIALGIWTWMDRDE